MEDGLICGSLSREALTSGTRCFVSDRFVVCIVHLSFPSSPTGVLDREKQKSSSHLAY